MPAAPTDPPRERLHYVQWLRVLLISFVVAQHSAEPYVTTGGDWLVADPASSDALLVFFVLNGTYFMGFFFLISGYFVEASIARNGVGGYLRARLVRLGIPLLFFVILVNGSIGYALEGGGSYLDYLFARYLPGGRMEFGPHWFLAHLLIYAGVYLALRPLLAPGGVWPPAPGPPGPRAILAYVLALGGLTALVRVVYPIDDWVRLFWQIPGEPARMAQYISLFAIGTLAGRGRWFSRLETRVALPWFALGAAVFAVTAALAAPRLALPDYFGLRVLWGFLEAFVGTGMILGLLVLFRAFCARKGRCLERLEGQVYGVYLVHVYVVIGLQAALVDAAWPALAKFAVVTGASLAVSFPLVALLRRIPAVQTVV